MPFAEILAGSSWIGRSEANKALANAIGRAMDRIGDDIPQADPPSSGPSVSRETQRWKSGGGGI